MYKMFHVKHLYIQFGSCGSPALVPVADYKNHLPAAKVATLRLW